jgi:hypothetical protein
MAARSYKMRVSATLYVKGKLPKTYTHFSHHKSKELAIDAANRFVRMLVTNAERNTRKDRKERRLRVNYMTVSPA